MLEQLKSKIMRNMANIPGWSANRKIVVFESDDWGSVRMSSKENRDRLIKVGFSFDGQFFNLYDALESNDDMAMLLELLSRYRDCNGRTPVFTIVGIVGNPDFDKIKTSHFTQYAWEPFTETLKRYPCHDQVYSLYKEGIANRLFYSVFHGREHLNVQRWLRKLRSGNKSVLMAFENGVTGIHLGAEGEYLGDFQAAFDLDQVSDLPFMEQLLKEGTDTFQKLWGYKARYFVPTNGPFNNSLEKTLKESGIDFILGERIQREPLGEGRYAKHFHYIGMQNKWKQTYLTRNGFFEPTIMKGDLNSQPIEKCLKSIERAFRWNKPAVISTHRLNYIGYIDPSNRDRSLRLLDVLLCQILKHWPDVEFMTSVELGDMIVKNGNK